MKRISRRACAKINLGLDVLGRREDGYHEVRMLMQQVDLHDDLILQKREDGRISMECDREDLPCDETNLCVRAAELMRRQYGLSGGLHIELTKRIPLAAGLAGGSADAAAVMLGMAELFGLAQDDREAMRRELMRLALQLGADIPYCLMGGTALAEGIGQILTPVRPALREIPTLIVKPAASVSTGEVYRAFDSCTDCHHPDIDGLLDAVRREAYTDICHLLGNILEDVTIPLHPEIRQLKNVLRDHGADAAMMSGSGPTVFAFFSEEGKMRDCRRKLLEQWEDLSLEGVFLSHTRGGV